ncbi:MAG: hypothetical protein H7249_03915 [Chitinophagaceae bacterium]|nr:hypothetical protein [Oligoflexus sp.]
MKKHLAPLLLVFIATTTHAADSNVQAMDSVLDRLEKKLMEQEAASLHIDPIPSGKKTTQNVRLQQSHVEGRLPGFDDFKGLETQIAQLEKEADELSGQIETLKGDLLSQASKGSLIEIAAVVEDPDLTAIRELNFYLDGNKIYSMDGGEWAPSPEIPFFLGPLEPGEHTLKLEARTARRLEKSLPLDQNLYHRYDQDFKIQVQPGVYHKGYHLKLVRPEQQNTRAQASLEAYDIP